MQTRIVQGAHTHLPWGYRKREPGPCLVKHGDSYGRMLTISINCVRVVKKTHACVKFTTVDNHIKLWEKLGLQEMG